MSECLGERSRDVESSSIINLHPLSLSFQGEQLELEPRFTELYFRCARQFIRVALCFFALCYGIFALVDPHAMAASHTEAWSYRFWVCLPLILAVLVLSFTPVFRHHWQSLLVLVTIAGGAGMVYMASMAPAQMSYLYHWGLVFTLLYAYVFFRLPFKFAFAVGLFLSALFLVHNTFIDPPEGNSLLVTTLFLVATNLIGLYSSYRHEYDSRQRFFLTTVLKEQNYDLAASNRMLSRISNLDGLTKVANRRSLDEYMTHTWERCLEHKQPLALMMCDIDFFKSFNDSYGHLHGDEVLIQVANVLKATIRVSDALTARYGGEEFVLAMPNVGPRAARSIAERIRKRVESLAIPHQGSDFGRVTISIGVVSHIPDSNCTIRDLYLSADKALYVAKDQGRNQVVCAITDLTPAKVVV